MASIRPQVRVSPMNSRAPSGGFKSYKYLMSVFIFRPQTGLTTTSNGFMKASNMYATPMQIMDNLGRFNLPLPPPTPFQGGTLSHFSLLEPAAQNAGCSCVVGLAHGLPNIFASFVLFLPETPFDPSLDPPLDAPGTPLDPLWTCSGSSPHFLLKKTSESLTIILRLS